LRLIGRRGPIARRYADQSMIAANADLERWEHHTESELDRKTSIAMTDREVLIIARVVKAYSKSGAGSQV
jgi:hypothetical protein